MLNASVYRVRFDFVAIEAGDFLEIYYFCFLILSDFVENFCCQFMAVDRVGAKYFDRRSSDRHYKDTAI